MRTAQGSRPLFSDAVRALIGDTRRDISFVAEDNPATGAVDETEFVRNVTSSSCPTTGINNCLGGVGTSTCDDCLQGAEVAFQFRLGNTSVTETATAQIFDFDMVGFAGAAEIGRIPVRVMVPEASDGSYGSGFYQNSLRLRFRLRDAARAARLGHTDLDRLDAIRPARWSSRSIQPTRSRSLIRVRSRHQSSVYPTDTTAQSYDVMVRDELISCRAGRITCRSFAWRAKLNASSDSLEHANLRGLVDGVQLRSRLIS